MHTLTAHTIDTDAGIVAGFLVRERGRELGRIWQAGSVWRWRSPDGSAYGERATQRAAIAVLHDVDTVHHGERLPFDIPPPTDRDILAAWRSTERAPSVASPIRPVRPIAAPAARSITWNDAAPAFDVTAAIADRLKGGR